MCGIVGYAGEPGGADALDVALEGLRRMEYRGYDSAGIVVQYTDESDDGALAWRKKAGKLANLVELLDAEPLPPSLTGVGHTRWATHGAPNDANAHPQLSTDGRLALVHNGIIENFAVLREELESGGVELRSETDTEVAAHLVACAFDRLGDLTQAMREVCNRLEGAFTLLAVHADVPGTVVGARRNSPLVVGRGDGANYLGSDVAAFIEHTRDAIELGQDQIATITSR
jgi:glucosamine--fructose-6-phosphate aminotransferase (isomerizing)